MKLECTPVVERDFRADEYYDAEVGDYEKLPSGRIVLRDRYQDALVEVARLLGEDYERYVEHSKQDDVVDIKGVITVLAMQRLHKPSFNAVRPPAAPDAKLKELSVDELRDMWTELEAEYCQGFNYQLPIVQFARAVMRRATGEDKKD